MPPNARHINVAEAHTTKTAEKSAADTAHLARFERDAAPLLAPLYRHAVRMTRNHADAEDVIADPHRVLAERLGHTNGARVVIRPDSYIGAISTFDDTNAINDYFARITS
jgi:hypothetical protein